MNTDQEIQLSDDLRHLVAHDHFQADPDALLRRARQARRHGLATRGVAGIGVLAVAAAVAVIGIDGGGSAGGPPVRDVSYVVAQVSMVLDKDSEHILRTTDLDDNAVTYQDQVTWNWYWVYGTGETRFEAWNSMQVVDHHTHLLDTTVSHQDKTYSTDDTKLPTYIEGAPGEPENLVKRVKKQISAGESVIVGDGEYQGHQVIKLGFAGDNRKSEFWVDSTTYEPVHSVTTDDEGKQHAADLVFLPRTPDQVKTVNTPQVPAGFTKVDQIPHVPGHGG